ncbi:hypothetical protein ZOSMA_75G00780 [Zostera marina]|uniref:Uncharacterized protein n=1 Tax=Zostera marina TaxID=29655 RepID=A0A0K9NPH9_ZOSMR|nr:hypothetical protein ZOSMA_75G00780 [Zostera marina]
MAIQWRATVGILEFVWMIFHSWVYSCLVIADEIAHAIHSEDIGFFFLA